MNGRLQLTAWTFASPLAEEHLAQCGERYWVGPVADVEIVQLLPSVTCVSTFLRSLIIESLIELSLTIRARVVFYVMLWKRIKVETTTGNSKVSPPITCSPHAAVAVVQYSKANSPSRRVFCTIAIWETFDGNFVIWLERGQESVRFWGDNNLKHMT